MMIIKSTARDNPAFIVDYNTASSLCMIRKISNQPVVDNSDNFNHIQRQRMSQRRNEDLYDVQYKVMLLGDSQVGKTSLQRFISGKDFRPDIGSTIGIDFVNKIIPIEKSKVNLQIWDTAGQRNFRTIGRSYYTSTKAFLLVYDVTNAESFYLVEQFNQLIEQTGLDMERRYLVGNKIDLIEHRQVDEETGRRFALRNSMTYFETSCRTGDNIYDLFEQVASDLIRQNDPRKLECHKPVKDNFAYNYQASSTAMNERTNNDAIENQTTSKKRNIFSSLSYESVDSEHQFDFRRLLFCCRPKSKSATKNYKF